MGPVNIGVPCFQKGMACVTKTMPVGRAQKRSGWKAQPPVCKAAMPAAKQAAAAAAAAALLALTPMHSNANCVNMPTSCASDKPLYTAKNDIVKGAEDAGDDFFPYFATFLVFIGSFESFRLVNPSGLKQLSNGAVVPTGYGKGNLR